MTISTTDSRVEYTGNGVTTAFSVPFYFLANADLEVYQDGTLKTITTHYTVSGAGNPAGGTVTFLSAPAGAPDPDEIIILRNPAITQETDYPPNDPFPAASHEQALDKLTMICQRLDERTTRALTLSDTVTGSIDVTLPAASAGKSLKWNATGDGFENSTYDPDEVVPLMEEQVTLAQGYATAASNSADASAASEASAAALFDQFDDRYLGSKAADPTLDNDGNALLTGALYYNSVTMKLRVYTGSSWQNSATAAPSSFTEDTFSGTGAQTAFTLSSAPASVQSCLVFISGVRQVPTTNYTVSGTTLTFVVAPPSGTNNITTLTVDTAAAGVPDNNSVSTSKIQDSAVTTAKIADANVTLAKLASDANAAGKHTIWIPAGAMTARTTNGPASGSVETTTNKVMVRTLDYDAATAEYAQFSIRMPKGWNESTVTAYFLWSNASGTGNVVWALQGVAVSDDDVLDAAFGTAQSVTDGVTAAGDLMQSAETSAITIAGSPAVGDLVYFQAYRDAANGADTLAVDARLHGVVVSYTTDAANDA